MIGVICAMAIEAQSFIERLTDCREEKILNISFWEEAGRKVCCRNGFRSRKSFGWHCHRFNDRTLPSESDYQQRDCGGFDLNTRLLDVVLGEQIAITISIFFDGAFPFGQVLMRRFGFQATKALAIASKVQLPNPIHRGRIITADCFQTDRKAVEMPLPNCKWKRFRPSIWNPQLSLR